MIYAQISGGLKLHLVLQPGEETKDREIIRRGELSQPICGKKASGYRMTCNLSLANSCKNCQRIYRARYA